MAFGLTVYASPGALPPHGARLASGRWSGATGRAFHPQDSYERFQRCCCTLSPFPKLLGTITSTGCSYVVSPSCGGPREHLLESCSSCAFGCPSAMRETATALGAWVAATSVSKRCPFARSGVQDPSRVAGLARNRITHLEATGPRFKWVECAPAVSVS
jgi:hypothetical protein